MKERTKLGLDVVQAALMLGVLGDALLRATPWGLNVLLWTAALVAALITLLVRWRRGALKGDGRWLVLPVIFFAAAFVWRDSMVLKTLDVLALLVALATAAWRTRVGRLRIAGVMEYALGGLVAALAAAFGAFPLLLRDVSWKELPREGWSKHLMAVARGVAIALPLLLVFSALFMAADAVFEGIINKSLHLNFGVLFSHAVLFVFMFWITAGFLRELLVGTEIKFGRQNELTALSLNQSPANPSTKPATDQTRPVTYQARVKSVTEHDSVEPPPSDSERQTRSNQQTQGPSDSAAQTQSCNETQSGSASQGKRRMFSLGIVEIGIVLGLLDALFLSFVLVQIRYFFGGAALVHLTTGMTYAEYARRGFFELVTVAALVLPVLLISHWLLRKENPAHERVFRTLAGLQVALLFVIMASAVGRMRLYQNEYGLTELRLYTTAFMGWLALVFVWFVWTVLRGRRERFACGALVAGFLMIGFLNSLNPDALIVRVNVAQSTAGRAFDETYAATLSADAVPALLDGLPSMSRSDRRAIAVRVLETWSPPEHTDWRTWNWSRARAWNAVREHLETLDESAKPYVESAPLIPATRNNEPVIVNAE